MHRMVVAHKTPDLDSIMSMWLLVRFAPGWENAELEFVPAGEKFKSTYHETGNVIEKLASGQEIIHVDTGLGKLDHHQTEDQNTCAASLTFQYVSTLPNNTLSSNKHKLEAVRRMAEIAVDVDHFQEVFYPIPTADQYDFTIVTALDGYRMEKPGDDRAQAEFGFTLLDAALHEMENKMWAEEEIEKKGETFETRWGKALAAETINDEVLKLAQRKGYVITVRKDPKSGNVRIKARPNKRREHPGTEFEEINVDLTPVYEKLKEKDPEATWYLHVSKRMLLNGSIKNPEMKNSKLSLHDVIEILKVA